MRIDLAKYAVAIGAGMTAALLFLAAIRGAPIGIAFAYLGPMPVMIATLGWGLDAGALAAVVAGSVVAGAAPPYALVYALIFAGPAYALSAFASLPSFRRGPPPDPPVPRAYPGPGAVSVLAAALFVLAGFLQLSLMLFGKGGYDAAVADLSAQIRGALDDSGAVRALPPEIGVEQLADSLVRFGPTALSTGATIMHLVNLYLAARTTQISGRLKRPWRDIPTGYVLPRALAVVTALAVGVAVVGPSPTDDYALVAAGAFGALYAMQGLAALHALSRRAAARPFMLAALYFACAVAAQWVLPALAVLGLAESFVNLRGRAARAMRTRT